MKREPVGRQNGAAIRAFRQKQHRSVADVARFIGLHHQGLRNIENGSRPASRDVILQLAEILDVPVAAITRDGTDNALADDETETDEAA